ncbi:MAG TPA: DUF3187 family protein [Gemmatimonadales bacterium]|nr:DUF3187 family protein [Gemmatimonadales bacterium]
MESRSGLYFQPLRPARQGLAVDIGLNYGSAIELAVNTTTQDTSYLLDAELLRLNVAMRKDFGAKNYLAAEAFVGGSYGGWMDKIVDAYHSLLGIKFPEREARATNEFGYRLVGPAGQLIVYDKSSIYLGDLRLTAGHRFKPFWQGELSLTLPTCTAGAGYCRGTVSMNAMTTVRAQLGRKWGYEGSAGVGYTPKHGDLSAWQEEVFVIATSGLRFHLGQKNSLFANLMVSSPNYSGSPERGLNNAEMDLDFGWMLRTKSGREWHVALTEDPQPSGPAIDLILRAGVSW